MNIIDISSLLEPISTEDSCGPDLEYDAAFGELERAAQRKPEQQMGDTVIPAEEPAWGDVKKKALELFTRTKDLRTAVYLTQALTGVNGLEGLADGLTLVKGLLAQYWEGVHPRLDPDDDNDPTFRVNTIASLAATEGMIQIVRQAPLLAARGFGQVKVRDLLSALSASPGEPVEEGQPDLATIEAAFMSCEPEAVKTLHEALTVCTESLKGIESTLVDRIGVGQSADLSALSDILTTTGQFVLQHLGDESLPGEKGEDMAAELSSSDSGSAPATEIKLASGVIASREDAIRMIDKVSEFFLRNEPSSPVPILLNRAKRLVSKNFMEIIEDVAPDGLAQIQKLGGVDSE